MSTSLTDMDFNATIQRALSGGNASGRSIMPNRWCRRAMRKRRKIASRPLAAVPRLGAVPRGPAKRQASGTSRTHRPQSGPPRAGMPAQPAFAPLPSELAFGPPTDISMGWDGTLWAIDISGAPHVYDPIQKQWKPHGEGVDAVAYVGNLIYHFVGPQFVTVTFGTNTATGAPQDIIGKWAWLPYSFRYGVQGAANLNGKLVLFHGGRYVEVDPDQPTVTSSVKKLSDLQNWPITGNWAGGAVDAVMGNGSNVVRLFRNGTYISVDLVTGRVTSPNPAPISSFVPWQGRVPADWLSTGIDAAFSYDTNDGGFTIYRGPAVVYFAGQTGPQPQHYLASTYSDWPSAWNPTLAHAPSGRIGNLWAAMADGQGVVYDDGAQWNAILGETTYASVGQDNSVFTVGQGRNTIWQWKGGTTFDQVGTAPSTLSQVSVGDTAHVWVRDDSNTVHRFDGSAFNPVTLVGTATHMAANADGTVWHCNAADSNAYRFISEGTAAPEAIPVGAQASVQKVASTGFGNAYCLVQPPSDAGTRQSPVQLYSYDSNYVFKTSASYNTVLYGQIEQGLGIIFFTTQEIQGSTSHCYINALDARTGQQVWRTPVFGPNMLGTSPVYDPRLKLLYVTSAPSDQSEAMSPGFVIALDAASGNLVWTTAAGTNGTIRGIDAPPTLAGSQLCVADRAGYIHMFDTDQAFALKSGVVASWSVQGPTGDQYTRVQSPLIGSGYVYTATWTRSSTGASVVAQQRNVGDGSLAFSNQEALDPGWTPDLFVPVAPVLGDLLILNQQQPALFVNGYDTLWALALEGGTYVIDYAPPGGAYFSSGLAYDNGLVWVGDSSGRLWAFDDTMHPTSNTPVETSGGGPILTTPLVDHDASANTYVAYADCGPASQQVWIFNPNEPAGAANPASLATGQTSITLLSRTVTNGVIYAAGNVGINPNDTGSGQVFAINIDRATQALRDLIIESQLMQDFDEAPAGQAEGATYARYQTHLTVVDDQKAPRAFEPVKIWADAVTTISIDGSPPVTVGPNDDQFAAVQTGADGTLVITSGYLTANAGDPTDVHTTPLRVWTGFMDPYERVVIFPDQEFHTRVATAVSVTDPTSPQYDDPTVVNLHAAASYAPPASYGPTGGTNPPLFTADELQQNQPANIAKAIQTMTKAVPTGGNASATASRLAAIGAAVGDKYTPSGYTLPGQTYFAVNTPATRPATPVAPIGFSLVSNDDDTVPTTYTALAHADASAAIDALTADQDWLTSPPGLEAIGASAGGHRVGGFWSSFWNWIKGAAAKITHLIISVGKEVYAGLRFIWNGVSYFFKHPLQTLEDVMSAVATFFQKLGKLIKNTVEALSILFNLGEIYKTHVLLRTELLRRVNGDPADPTHYPGLVNAINNSIIPNVKTYFDDIEGAVSGYFNKLANEVAGTKTSDLQGSGSTAHTALTVTSKATGQRSSQSAPGMWANQKLKNNYRSASVDSSGFRDVSGDPISDAVSAFFTDFVASITNNGPLEAQWAQVSQGLKNLANAHSAGAFISQGLAELLRAIAGLLDGIIAVGKALVEGLMGMLVKVVDALFNPNTGLLTRTLNIPVLSWLYQKIFGEPLTILNVITLVAAIPVTLLYRVATGQWPAQAASEGAQAVGANAGIVKIVGLFGGLISIVSGIINAISDAEGTDSPPQPVPALATASSTLGFLIGIPVITNSNPGSAEWAEWGTSGGVAAVSILSLPNPKNNPNLSNFATYYSSGQTALLGAAQLALFIYSFVKANKSDVASDIEFGLNMAGALDNLINPLKLLGAVTDGAGPVIVACVDGIVGFVVGGINILLALQIDSPAPVPLMRQV